MTELAEPFTMSLPAVSKHLKVLQLTGLITRQAGSVAALPAEEAAPLKDVADWVERYRSFWEQSFDRLDEYLQALQQPETTPRVTESDSLTMRTVPVSSEERAEFVEFGVMDGGVETLERPGKYLTDEGR